MTLASPTSTFQPFSVTAILTGMALVLASWMGASYAVQMPVLDQIKSIKADHNISATAFGIVSRDNIICQHALGYHTHEGLSPVTLDSIFRIGSITKTFTAIGALLLSSKYAFELDNPIADYLRAPPVINPWDKTNPISTRNLLEHTAGFYDLSPQEFDQLQPLELAAAFRVNPISRISMWPPGMHSSYSNSGAGVTAAVVEAVSQKDFAQYMRRNVFQPLQLNSASLVPPNNAQDNFVGGYDSDGVSAIPYWHQLYPSFGAMNVSTTDMLKFVQILLNDGRRQNKQILPLGFVEKMLTPTSTLAARSGLRYGYGLGIYQFQNNGVSFYGHGGDADGYLAFFAFSPALDRGYYLVINAYNPKALRMMRDSIEEFLVAGRAVQYPEVIQLTPKNRARLLGTYQAVTRRFNSAADKTTTPIRLRVLPGEKGTLITKLDEGVARPLVPVEQYLFRRPWQSVATSALIEFKGEIFLQGDFGNFRKIGE